MSKFMSLTLLAVLSLFILSGCGINNIPTYDEAAKAAWSQVENQYQRRADLIPNLVETVKGFAKQEKDVLVQVTEARSKVAQIYSAHRNRSTGRQPFYEFQLFRGEIDSIHASP